jgi:RNA polymerase sigma-70 factor (ECF subfamily)
MSAVTPDQLGALLSTHGAALRLYARQWCEGAADDVVQEAFVQLARQATVPQEPAAWLFRVVRNGAISAQRSAARRRRHETTAAADRSDWFESRPESRVDATSAVAALNELYEEQREVVVAHLWGGLTFEQIAELVGTSSSTAHRRYEQGLKTLRERLEKRCPTKNH